MFIVQRYRQNKSDYIGLSTETKPTLIGVGSTFFETNTKNKYMFDGTTWIVIDEKYRDLGEVINATNVPAGGFIFSGWYDEIQWVRQIVFLSKSDQTYDYGIYRRDSSGQQEYQGATLKSNASGNTTWIPNTYIGSGCLMGYGVKFYVKNSSVSTNTLLILKTQLLGV